MNTALTIGVSDSSGGAGIQADLKAFTVLGVYGMAAVTAVVARNTQGPKGGKAVQSIDRQLVASQIDAIAEDFPVGALKTGYLGSPAMIDAVAETLRRHNLDHYVCDPVMHSHSGPSGGGGGGGGEDSATLHAYRKELLPLATVTTLNRAEAALLSNMEESEVAVVTGARKAAEKIIKTGTRAVVIKGLLTGDRATDLFYDGSEFIEFAAKRATTRNTYGSGCLFSSIITAMLAQQIELRTAVDHARSFVSQAIEHHAKLGQGARPVNVLALMPQ